VPTSTDPLPVLVLSTSLRAKSHSRILAQRCRAELESLGCEVRWIDLAERELPFCDAGECYGHPHAVEIREAVEWAAGIVLATPIYNYNLSGQAKAAVEIAGKAFTGKVVGFLCAAGGEHSYMSILGIANSLMLDFRTWIVPRFVYATYSAFEEDRLVNEEVLGRIGELAQSLSEASRTLSPRT
jgi:FMN reductase